MIVNFCEQMWVLILLKDEIYLYFSKNNMCKSHVYLISSPFRFCDCMSYGWYVGSENQKILLPWITDESLQRRRMRNRQLFHKSLLRMQVPGIDVDGVWYIACPATNKPRQKQDYPRPASAGLASPRTGNSYKVYIHHTGYYSRTTYRAKQIGWPHFHVLFNIDFGGIWYPSTAVGFGSV